MTKVKKKICKKLHKPNSAGSDSPVETANTGWLKINMSHQTKYNFSTTNRGSKDEGFSNLEKLIKFRD